VLAAAWLASCGGNQPPPDREPAPGERAEFEASPGLFIERACTPSGPELCFNAVDDNCNGILDEGCGVRNGLVQFAIGWDEPHADVDLNVTDPAGVLIEVGRAAASGLVKERDCPGAENECRGQNMENVFLEEGEPVRGPYRVRVQLEKLGGANPPIRVRLWARVGPKTYASALMLQRPGDQHEIRIKL
jgi:hypothetical protein